MHETLPPMLARPFIDPVKRPGPKYRATVEARRAFKLQCLEDLAEALDDGVIGGAADDYGLTEAQAASVRAELARTALRNTEARLARMTAVAEDLAAEQGPAGQLVELLTGIADLAEGIEAMTDALVARLEW